MGGAWRGVESHDPPRSQADQFQYGGQLGRSTFAVDDIVDGIVVVRDPVGLVRPGDAARRAPAP